MVKFIVWLACFSVFIWTVSSSYSSETSTNESHMRWLEERLKEAESVKVGMSRADLLATYQQEGGIYKELPTRYFLKSCRYIRISVEFEVDTQEKAPASDDEIKIKNIVGPCLGYPIYD